MSTFNSQLQTACYNEKKNGILLETFFTETIWKHLFPRYPICSIGQCYIGSYVVSSCIECSRKIMYGVIYAR